MNREVEFRGKRLDNGQWVYGDLSHHSDGIPSIRCRDEKGMYHPWYVEPETVGQYTGSKDKNGTKIYGDDILHWENLLLINDPDIEDNGDVQVVFEYGSWRLKKISGSELARWGLWKNIADQDTENDIAFEVIGNIYENLEPLEAN
jgi:uncharacterized phage protein (TIGR01671 family)